VPEVKLRSLGDHHPASAGAAAAVAHTGYTGLVMAGRDRIAWLRDGVTGPPILMVVDLAGRILRKVRLAPMPQAEHSTTAFAWIGAAVRGHLVSRRRRGQGARLVGQLGDRPDGTGPGLRFSGCREDRQPG